MRTISTRRTTIAAALEYARSEHETLYREAGSTALESGDDADEAQATYCRSVIAHPGSASDAWVNAGASKLCGVPARWEPLFLRTLDAEAVRLARLALA
jgi:hypothetical protein